LFIKFAFAVPEVTMLRPQFILFLPLFLLTLLCHGQETDPGPGYQMVMMNNPALAGSEGTGTLRLSYLNFYPGNGYNLHSIYLSFDSYFQTLHGGASFYLAEDYLGGAVNNIRGGISYSYFLQAGEYLFINAGLTGSIYHQGYNFSNSVLPDQIDPLGGVTFPSAEALKASGSTVFDLGTGFTFIRRWLSGGLAIVHLTEPDLSYSGMQKDVIKRKLFVHLCGDLPLGKSRKLYARPVTYISYQGDYLLAGGGLSVENEHIGINLVGMGDNSGNVNIQTGFSFRAGIVRFNYLYRFNVVSENNLMPMSLLHETGLAFSLYDVDKRKSIKTINFPKL
jgi:type IX secretion system PorP/SprF family membrane protein